MQHSGKQCLQLHQPGRTEWPQPWHGPALPALLSIQLQHCSSPPTGQAAGIHSSSVPLPSVPATCWALTSPSCQMLPPPPLGSGHSPSAVLQCTQVPSFRQPGCAALCTCKTTAVQQLGNSCVTGVQGQSLQQCQRAPQDHGCTWEQCTSAPSTSWGGGCNLLHHL